MKNKLISLVVAAVVLVATLGTVGAQSQKTYARNPSIQNSKYYVLEFSIESNAEKAFLILDGKEHKMHKEGENYVCRTSFGDGDHEYYFLLDETRFPERGSYRITEVERRWILLSSLIDKFNWKLDEERELARKQKNTEELFKLQKSRIEACAMIQGVTKRILVSEVFDPKNFNTENVFDKIDMEKLDKLTKEYDIKRERKGDTLESLYTFFKELGGNYIAVAANSYGEKSNRIGHDKKAVQELEAAKKEKDWISVTERADRLIKDGQETEKALKYKYLALTRLYGDKSVELLKREENKGYSVRTLYDWTGECHPDKTKYHQGYTFINQVDAYWGKLLGVEAMDFDILAAGNCSLYCMDVEVQMSVKHGCIVIPPDQGWNVTAHNENYLSLSRVSYKVSPWIDLWGNPHYRTLMNATANFDDHEENFDGVVTVSLNFKVGT